MIRCEKDRKNFECYRKCGETFYDLGNVHVCNNGISSIHGKELLEQLCQSIANTTDLTPKQMFDISTKSVSEQDEISGLETIGWENHSWKYLSLIGDERIINLQRTKVYVFPDSVLCLGKNPSTSRIQRSLEEKDSRGQSRDEKVSMSPRLPPKISLRHDWTKELGSKVDRQPEGEVARQAKFFQPTQPIPNPIRD